MLITKCWQPQVVADDIEGVDDASIFPASLENQDGIVASTVYRTVGPPYSHNAALSNMLSLHQLVEPGVSVLPAIDKPSPGLSISTGDPKVTLSFMHSSEHCGIRLDHALQGDIRGLPDPHNRSFFHGSGDKFSVKIMVRIYTLYFSQIATKNAYGPIAPGITALHQTKRMQTCQARSIHIH